MVTRWFKRKNGAIMVLIETNYQAMYEEARDDAAEAVQQLKDYRVYHKEAMAKAAEDVMKENAEAE